MKKKWHEETVRWERRVFSFTEVCELLGFEPMETDYVELKVRSKETSHWFHLANMETLMMSRRIITRTKGGNDEK